MKPLFEVESTQQKSYAIHSSKGEFRDTGLHGSMVRAMRPHSAEDEAKEKITGILERCDPETRTKIGNQLKDILLRDKEHAETELAHLNLRIAALREIRGWWGSLQQAVSLQKNDCSRFHKFASAAISKRLLGSDAEPLVEESAFALKACQHSFVVKHDWAAAFSHASGLSDDIKLPYALCAFEFRINDRTVISLDWDEEETGRKGFCIFIEAGEFWTPINKDLDQDSFCAYIRNQVRCICIALDADVATQEVVRAPAKLNEKRIAEGKLPLLEYRVVELSKRHLIANPANLGGMHRSPRLHFVRGHWRRYELSKTWIKWHLRGNHELGYIQKHYSL